MGRGGNVSYAGDVAFIVTVRKNEEHCGAFASEAHYRAAVIASVL